MVKKRKEDRSDWVAVQPESSAAKNSPPPIKPAKSAYYFFQKENSSIIQKELLSSSSSTSSSGLAPAVDVGALGREVSSRWQNLPPSERRNYEELAEQDKIRYLSESHKRDIDALERKERLRKERETLILDDHYEEDGNGGRATRQKRRKQERKVEKKRAKKEEKK